MSSTYVGEGVRRALWQLVLAMVFKALITNVLNIAVIIRETYRQRVLYVKYICGRGR